MPFKDVNRATRFPENTGAEAHQGPPLPPSLDFEVRLDFWLTRGGRGHLLCPAVQPPPPPPVPPQPARHRTCWPH